MAPNKVALGLVVKAFHSKQYLRNTDPAHKRESMEGLIFFDILRKTSDRVPRDLSVQDWTLANLLESAREADV